MRRTILLAATLLCCAASATRADEGATRVDLDAPEVVDGLHLEDATGDGRADLFLLRGRTLHVYPGRAEGLPDAKPAFTATLPDDVTFLDVRTPGPGGPSILVLGEAGVRTLALGDGGARPFEGTAAALTWSDGQQAAFADLVRPDGALLLPTTGGFAVHPSPDAAWPVREVRAPMHLDVRPPGGFVEDVGVVTRAHAPVWWGPPIRPGAAPTLWTLGGAALVADTPFGAVRRPVDVLPPAGDRRLLDLDGDGAPEVIHLEVGNLNATLAAFRAPRLALDGDRVAATGGDLRSPAAVLRLAGYVVRHDFLDLDRDGRLDFVVTTIPVDIKNTLRALGGRVTAYTRAFLNRGAEGRMYPAAADATVISDVEVEVRFSPAGRLDIRRHFTILPTCDLDGDGRLDLAIRTGKEELTVRRGVGDGVWEETGAPLAIPPLGPSLDVDAWAADLTADGRDEIVLVYRRPPGGRDRVRVIRSP